MKKKLTLALGILMLITTLTACTTEPAPPEATDWDFPSIHITFDMHVERNTWKDATVTITGTEEAHAFENAEARIRGRGNTSWQMGYWTWGANPVWERSKQPFRLRFNPTVSMLDSGYEARDWTFIANLSDLSLMRNYSAYHLASLLDGMDYAPFARFVHVYFDSRGQTHYRGLYMLCVQLSEVMEHRVDLRGDPDPASSEYLIQMCMRADWHDGVYGEDFITVNTRHYEIPFPRGNDLSADHIDYVRDFLTKIDTAIFATDEAVFEYIDLDSFIDFFIVQELYKNPDIHFSSVWMQLKGEGEDRRLHIGPVWDFDLAAGNAYHQGQHFQGEVRLPPGIESYEYGYGPYGHFASVFNQWYRYLMEQPRFQEALVQRWPYLGYDLWPNPEAVVEIDTFMGQVEYLIDFLERRAAWLECGI